MTGLIFSSAHMHEVCDRASNKDWGCVLTCQAAQHPASSQMAAFLLQAPPAAGRSASADAAFAVLSIPCSVQAMLERAGVRVMLNELSSTVVFERPTEEAFVRKWQLACQVSGPRRACSGIPCVVWLLGLV